MKVLQMQNIFSIYQMMGSEFFLPRFSCNNTEHEYFYFSQVRHNRALILFLISDFSLFT